MRNLLISATLIFFSLGAFGRGPSRPKLSELPNGTLSGNIYTNDALGLRFTFPSDWVATADPAGAVEIDYQNSLGPVNQCSRILLSYHAPNKTEGKFNSIAILFITDPRCFPIAEFPHSPNDKNEIHKFAKSIFDYFSNTPYISSHRTDFFEDHANPGLTIMLTGEANINAVEDPRATTKEPLHVNTLLGLKESHGYWIAWGFLADDRLKDVLINKTILELWEEDAPKRKMNEFSSLRNVFRR